MAYPGVIAGLFKLIDKHGHHEILLLLSDYDCVKLCAVLYNNFRVLNYHMADLFNISSGEMSVFRRLDREDLTKKENIKLLSIIRPKLYLVIDMAKSMYKSKKE
jgi:hypothetical protein